jgi:hypothetical protein
MLKYPQTIDENDIEKRAERDKFIKENMHTFTPKMKENNIFIQDYLKRNPKEERVEIKTVSVIDNSITLLEKNSSSLSEEDQDRLYDILNKLDYFYYI